MNPSQLSRELRLADTDTLTRRRAVVALSNVGALAGIIVSLYQTGVIHHLPDLPGTIWNADKVDASDYAYKRARTPDALMMTVSYGITAWLAGAGGKRRAEELPLLPVALAGKVIGDAFFALKLGREEWKTNHALCWYCQSATLASLASVPLVLPEARKGLKRLFGR